MVTDVSKRIVSIERLEAPPRLPTVEIQVGSETVLVTVDLAHIRDDDLEVVVTRTSIQLGSRAPDAQRFLVPLPVNVEPGRHVVRSLHGVVDVHLARAARSH